MWKPDLKSDYCKYVNLLSCPSLNVHVPLHCVNVSIHYKSNLVKHLICSRERWRKYMFQTNYWANVFLFFGWQKVMCFLWHFLFTSHHHYLWNRNTDGRNEPKLFISLSVCFPSISCFLLCRPLHQNSICHIAFMYISIFSDLELILKTKSPSEIRFSYIQWQGKKTVWMFIMFRTCTYNVKW